MAERRRRHVVRQSVDDVQQKFATQASHWGKSGHLENSDKASSRSPDDSTTEQPSMGAMRTLCAVEGGKVKMESQEKSLIARKNERTLAKLCTMMLSACFFMSAAWIRSAASRICRTSRIES